MRDLHTGDHSVITLIRFKRNLLDGLELAFLQFVDFVRKDSFRGNCRVDTAGLDGDNDMAAVLQEVLGVQNDDAGLVWLGDIGKNDVYG